MKIAVIGAGVVGSLIARELCKYDAEVLLIEKNMDVGWGVTKANSAILHAGYDDPVGSVRSKFCSLGNAMYTELAKELDFEIKRTGSYVLAFNDEEISVLHKLLKQGEVNKVPGLELHDRDEILSREPRINPKVKMGLWAPTAGITEPWMIAIAAVENALENGLKLFLNEEVIGFEKSNGKIKKIITNKQEHSVDIVINVAGLFADEISKLAGAEYVPLHPRKGQYILLDKKLGKIINSVIFPTPTEKSKGILVLPTIDGGLLLGPTAEDLPSDRKHDLTTTGEGLQQIKDFVLKLVPDIDFSLVVKTFAGLRPESPQKDFFISASRTVQNFINVMAMRSPGLTAAPAIAKYVVEDLIQDQLKLTLKRKRNFKSKREAIKKYAQLSLEEWQEVVARKPSAGRMICFCNEVTEAEIVEAISRGARTLDGVKFRTRAMFGRCQGGFCMSKILKILERELGTDASNITLKSPGSWIVDGKVRE